MSKKFLYPIGSAVLVAIMLSAFLVPSALAQGGQPTTDPDRQPGGLLGRLRRLQVLGQVTAVTDQQLSLTTRQGRDRTFRLDDQTRFRTPDGTEMTLADVKVGNWVSVVVGPLARLRRGEPPARVVVILPDGFDPEKMQAMRGEVTSVGADTFTVKDRQGATTTVKVNADTAYNGQAKSLSELKAGMKVLSMAEKQADGSLLALTVRAGNPLDRIGGKVTAVTGNAFTIQARDGKSYTFAVNAGTRFRSLGGFVQGISDLKAGMVVFVRTEDLTAGQPVAIAVLALRVK